MYEMHPATHYIPDESAWRRLATGLAKLDLISDVRTAGQAFRSLDTHGFTIADAAALFEDEQLPFPVHRRMPPVVLRTSLATADELIAVPEDGEGPAQGAARDRARRILGYAGACIGIADTPPDGRFPMTFAELLTLASTVIMVDDVRALNPRDAGFMQAVIATVPIVAESESLAASAFTRAATGGLPA